jgi:hypothetical protein
MSSIIVTIPYDNEWDALDWARGNCPSYIAHDTHIDKSGRGRMDMIDYFFGEKQDAIMFALRWA